MADPSPIGRFLLRCTVDTARGEEVAARRSDHLAHVAAHRHLVAFGGVIDPDGALPRAICYVLDVPDRAAAEAFTTADPYAPLYTEVRIEPFVQRLPPPPEVAP